MIVYVWSRRNPAVLMNFLGIFNFTAPYMPWVLLGFSLLLSGQLPVADVIGIVVGHAYYYLSDVFPRLYGWYPLQTPGILSHFLNPRDPIVDGPMESLELDVAARTVLRAPRLEITDSEEEGHHEPQDFAHEE